MNATLRHELRLGSVPNPVGGRGRLELLKVVKRLPFVACMPPQGFLCPLRQAVVMVEGGQPESRVEAELSPDNELVEEGLGWGRHSPPPLLLAFRCRRQLSRVPTFMLCHGVQYLMSGDVTEVKVGRESGSGVEFWIGAIVLIAAQTILKEAM